MVHDGNVYFEHCYGSDFEPKVADSDREACWNAWLAHYTRHQAAHRIDYAMRRVESLQSAEPGLALPGIPNPGAPETIPPDPEGDITLMGPRAGAEAATVLENSAEIPHGCTAACGALEQACDARCPADASTCHKGCATERATCLGGCY
jgi:hypothetical protein